MSRSTQHGQPPTEAPVTLPGKEAQGGNGDLDWGWDAERKDCYQVSPILPVWTR